MAAPFVMNPGAEAIGDFLRDLSLSANTIIEVSIVFSTNRESSALSINWDVQMNSAPRPFARGPREHGYVLRPISCAFVSAAYFATLLGL